MKKITLQKLATVTALLAAFNINTASAHTLKSSLGTPAGSIDVYQTSCGKNTGQLITTVQSGRGIPLVSVQAYKGKFATNTTDAVNGNVATSSVASLKGAGPGFYTVLVNKNRTGLINYTVEVHCQTLKGAHTNQPEPVQLQNQ